MPAMASRGGSRRRTISEINMVPFIDVMLVLLIIFMVSAPLIAPSAVDVPSIGQAKKVPDKIIEIVVAEAGSYKLRVNGQDMAQLTLKELPARVKSLQDAPDLGFASDTPKANTARKPPAASGPKATDASANGKAPAPVIISADRNIKYDEVVKVMDGLQRAGVQRIGLAVKTSS